MKNFKLDIASFGGAIAFPDFVASCRDVIDPSNPDSLQKVAPHLKRLALNRDFMVQILKERALNALDYPHHSKWQNIPTSVLHDDASFTIRAVFWDKLTGEHDFDHNHNFDFLTVGYFGPGYIQDVYEYDGQDELFPGKAIPIKKLGRDRLAEGEVRYFRSDRIIHSFPSPCEFSISLNVIHKRKNPFDKPQFSFDVNEGLVKDLVSPHFDEMLVRIASSFVEDADFFQAFTGLKYSSACRIAAIKALSTYDPAVLSQYEDDASAFVRDAIRRVVK